MDDLDARRHTRTATCNSQRDTAAAAPTVCAITDTTSVDQTSSPSPTSSRAPHLPIFPAACRPVGQKLPASIISFERRTVLSDLSVLESIVRRSDWFCRGPKQGQDGGALHGAIVSVRYARNVRINAVQR